MLKVVHSISREWSERARELLYKHVFLGEPKAKVRCKALDKILEQRPDLLQRTQTLTICEATTWKSKELRTEGWIQSSEEILFAILRHFQSLRAIALKGTGGKANMDWDLIPTSIKLYLCNLFAMPHCKALSFRNVSNLQNVLTFLTGLGHLKRLCLFGCDVT